MSNVPPIPSGLSSADKVLIILCHLSPFLSVPFLLPLIVYLVKREDSAIVAHNAKEALNFHISFFVYAIPCALLVVVFVGIFLLAALGVIFVILCIIATIKGSEGVEYRYPLTFRLI